MMGEQRLPGLVLKRPAKKRNVADEDKNVFRRCAPCERCSCERENKMIDGWHCVYCGVLRP